MMVYKDAESVASSNGNGGGPAATAMRCITDDIDEFTASLNSVFYPATVVNLAHDSDQSAAELVAARLKHLTIGRARFGSPFEVDPGDLGCYHVNIPLTGTVVSQCGEQQTVARPGHAAVFSPNEHTVLSRWDADATQICIKIERGSLERELVALLGCPVDKRIRFDMGMDLTTAAGAHWFAMVNFLLDALDAEPAVTATGRAPQVEYLERAVIAGLVMRQRHTLTDRLYTAPQPLNQSALQKVLDHIHSCPGSQFSVGDLAGIAGVGARQLHNLFYDQFEMSPTSYVRNVRLDGARTDLLTGETTVSDIAFRWGFNHLGRFAQRYEQKFGESPSATLRAQ
jgi:AraC-like DNA-binding protein